MTARCTECEKVFDSHDGGTVIGDKCYCPECEEALEEQKEKESK